MSSQAPHDTDTTPVRTRTLRHCGSDMSPPLNSLIRHKTSSTVDSMSCARAVSHRTCAPLRGLTSTDCQSGGLVLRYPLHRAPGRQVTSLTARRRSIRIAGSAELVSVDVQLEGHEEGVLTPTQRSPPSALLPHHLHSEPRLTCWCQERPHKPLFSRCDVSKETLCQVLFSPF